MENLAHTSVRVNKASCALSKLNCKIFQHNILEFYFSVGIHYFFLTHVEAEFVVTKMAPYL